MRPVRYLQCLALVAAALMGPATALALAPHQRPHAHVTRKHRHGRSAAKTSLRRASVRANDAALTVPVVTITGGPSGTAASSSATFTMSRSGPETLHCQLDASAWSACN